MSRRFDELMLSARMAANRGDDFGRGLWQGIAIAESVHVKNITPEELGALQNETRFLHFRERARREGRS